MRRVGLVAVVLIFTFALSLSAAAAGAAPAKGRAVTFHLVEKQLGFNFIDNPPRQGFRSPPLMGDQFVFTSEVRTRAGKHAGWIDATCIVARGGTHTRGPCYGVFSFKGGQLMGIAEFGESNVTNVVIVGGTGAYRGATGTVRSVSRGENNPYTDDTFQLELPA